MKIIVTGALGHIGSQLIRELPKDLKIDHLVLIDDLSTQRYSSLFNLPGGVKYTFIESRVQDLNWMELLMDVDVVVNLAAITDAAGTSDKPELVHNNNFELTKTIADACFATNVPLIFPSSTSVYGSQEELVDEECMDLQPQSPYADCKIREEKYISELSNKGLKAAICRLGTIYGTSQGMRFHTAVNKFCWQAVMKQPITVWKTAMDQKRPYLDLKDCCQAISWIIKNSLYTAGVYNIVSNNLTVRDVIENISNIIPDLNIQFVEHKIMNQLSYEVCSKKFKLTGYEFRGNLFSKIKETIFLLNNSMRN